MRNVSPNMWEGAKAAQLAIDAEGSLAAAGWDELTAADAIIFGSPTYMGGHPIA